MDAPDLAAWPVIALPGTLLDERSLAPLLAQAGLAAPHTLLLGEAPTLDDELDRLAAQARGDAQAQPAVWIGHSLGGIVALHLAARHPGCVVALVLMGANARPGRDADEARRAAQWALACRDGLGALAQAKLAPGYGLKPGRPQDAAMLQALAAQAQAVGLARFERQLGYARRRPGLLSPRRPLPVPMLVLSAEHDTLCPPAHGDEIAGLVQPPARAAHHMLPGAGHLFPMQRPGWVAARLRHFLATLMLEPT